MSYQPIPITHC